MARKGREWSPRGSAEVWLLLWTGDWGVRYEIYGSEELAWKAVEMFMKTRLSMMSERNKTQIEEALRAGELWLAYNMFTEYWASYGNNLDVDRVLVRH